MPIIKVSTEGDNTWSDLRELAVSGSAQLIQAMGEGTVWNLTILEGGMKSGAYSVGLRLDLPDGRHVVTETSWAAFETAYKALAAKINPLQVRWSHGGGGRWA